jgi:hypothetical protein
MCSAGGAFDVGPRRDPAVTTDHAVNRNAARLHKGDQLA